MFVFFAKWTFQRFYIHYQSTENRSDSLFKICNVKCIGLNDRALTFTWPKYNAEMSIITPTNMIFYRVLNSKALS